MTWLEENWLVLLIAIVVAFMVLLGIVSMTVAALHSLSDARACKAATGYYDCELRGKYQAIDIGITQHDHR